MSRRHARRKPAVKHTLKERAQRRHAKRKAGPSALRRKERRTTLQPATCPNCGARGLEPVSVTKDGEHFTGCTACAPPAAPPASAGSVNDPPQPITEA